MKKKIMYGLICYLPTLISIFIWNKLPEKIPTYFGFSGDANIFSSKFFAFIVIPTIYYLLHILIVYISTEHRDWLGGKNSTGIYPYSIMPFISIIFFYCDGYPIILDFIL